MTTAHLKVAVRHTAESRDSMDSDHSDGRASLNLLPDDIVELIISHVSPLDNLTSLQLACHRLHRLSNQPPLWRDHCRTSFKYWHPRHRLQEKLASRASEVDWKKLFVTRHGQNVIIGRILDHVLATRVGRIAGMQQICSYGYDAKDFLLEQCSTEDSMEDVLSRRYFSSAVLGSIHRSIAIRQWVAIGHSVNAVTDESRPSLEKGLAAFDIFVQQDQPGDVDEVPVLLDRYAAAFMATQPKWSDKNTREKALSLNRWLRRNNLTGLRDAEEDYRNLRNCLIGQALRDSRHESIPIISCAIYSCLAERLGIDAECYLAPMCVHVIVKAPDGVNLDGNFSPEKDTMFLDPFGTSEEVPVVRLQTLAEHAGLTLESLQTSGTTFAVATRTAHNIEASYAAGMRHNNPLSLSRLLHGHAAVNRQMSLYSARWAILILNTPFSIPWNQRFSHLLRYVLQNWPEDEWIVGEYVASLDNQDPTDPALEQLAAFIHNIHGSDQLQPSFFQSQMTAERVAPFHIGQIFHHRRYNWVGAIVGFYEVPPSAWGLFDNAGEGSAEAGSPGEERRRFYVKTIPSAGTDERVIAPGNIALISDSTQVTSDMFPLAGKFFKRFDASACRFISNVDEEYPCL